MIVAMGAMRMMQMARDEVIDVIAMGDRIVPAALAVHMCLSVSGTPM
jgi:hypothetical protein